MIGGTSSCSNPPPTFFRHFSEVSVMDLKEKIKRLPPLSSIADLSNFVESGDGWQGPHPVHGSTSGDNFMVHEDSYHCFRCDSDGDILKYVAMLEGIIDCSESDVPLRGEKFNQAYRKACDMAGIEHHLEDSQPQSSYREVMKAAMEYFRKNLLGVHRDWIRGKYGYSDKVIDDFQLGFAPDKADGLVTYLVDAGFKSHDIRASGLFNVTEGGVSDSFRGRIVFPYLHYDVPRYFIARGETPWSREERRGKFIKQYVHSERREHLSKDAREPIFGEDSLTRSGPVIITEGIPDAISAISNGFACISPVTVRFRKKDIERVKALVGGRKVYICNDSEDNNAGFKGALDMISELHDDSYLVELPRPAGVSKLDLNDFFKEHSAWELKTLMEKAHDRRKILAIHKGDIISNFVSALRDNGVDPSSVRKEGKGKNVHYVPIDSLLGGIDNIKDAIGAFRRTEEHSRSPNLLNPSTRNGVISSVISIDLESRGRFLNQGSSQAMESYYFYDAEGKIKRVDNMWNLLWLLYGVNASTKEGKYVQAGIIGYAQNYGESISIHESFFFEEHEKSLYIYDRASSFYKLEGDSITHHKNGTDGIYMTGNQWGDKRPYQISYIPEGKRITSFDADVVGEVSSDNMGLLDRVMVNRTNFGSDGITADYQRRMLKMCLYTIPFYSYMTSRPIMVFTGEKGSGKSMSCQMFGWFLTGCKDFKVSVVSSKEDFMLSVSKYPFFTLDNVDSPDRWMKDAFAQASTGISRKTRKLYSNADEVTHTPISFLAITTRDPFHFFRDDVVDRSLIFTVDRYTDFIPEEALYDPIFRYYDTIWSEFIDNLNKIVKKLREDPVKNKSSKHRMATWSLFAGNIWDALGIGGDVDEMLSQVDFERTRIVLNNNPIFSALKDWLMREQSEVTEWIDATELYRILSEGNHPFAKDVETPIKLGRIIGNIEKELKAQYGMVRRKNSHTKAHEYRFTPGFVHVATKPAYADALKMICQCIDENKGPDGGANRNAVEKLATDNGIDDPNRIITAMLNRGEVKFASYPETIVNAR